MVVGIFFEIVFSEGISGKNGYTNTALLFFGKVQWLEFALY
jgi:hypothetical protein